jgi:hypothetical protein
MAADTSALDALITRLRRSHQFVTTAAPAAAEAMAAALRAAAASGASPDGAAWAEKKKGGRALVNAAAKIVVRAVGTVLLARIGFPESVHNVGTKVTPKRQILPTSMPPAVAEAIKRSLIASWESQ